MSHFAVELNLPHSLKQQGTVLLVLGEDINSEHSGKSLVVAMRLGRN